MRLYFVLAGVSAARGAPIQEARARCAHFTDQRDRSAGDVAADHSGDVSDLRGRQPRHGGYGVLSAFAPLHHGAAVRAAQHGGQPDTVRRSVRELPQVFRAAVVHIETPAGHEPRSTQQYEQGWRRGRWWCWRMRQQDSQQRALQLDAATGQFRFHYRIPGGHGHGCFLVHSQQLLVRFVVLCAPVAPSFA